MIALIVGGLAAFLVREVVKSMADASDRARMTSTIVVAKKAIPFGAPLTRENLQVVPWMSADPLDGSFANDSDLLRDGRRLALISLQPNEPVLSSRVTAPNQRATLATQLDDAMRAVTIRVDEVRGVAGFIQPGDRVDVISTRGESGSVESSAYADILLQNAKVLAIDQLLDERQDKPTVARAVTLEVNVRDAQKVVLAEGIGRLSLMLRPPNDAVAGVSARVTASDLGGEERQARDRVADLEKRLADLKATDEAARADAQRVTAEKLAELEARLRSAPDVSSVNEPASSPSADASRPVVNVIRNGSKAESYTVSAER